MRGRLTAMALAAVLAGAGAGPASAQSLFEDGDRLSRLLEGLARDLAPHAERLHEDVAPLLDEFIARVDPYLSELRGLLGDLTRWEAPEVLPNGDILIRRRPPEAPVPPPGRPDLPEDEAPVTEPLEL